MNIIDWIVVWFFGLDLAVLSLLLIPLFLAFLPFVLIYGFFRGRQIKRRDEKIAEAAAGANRREAEERGITVEELWESRRRAYEEQQAAERYENERER